MGFFFSIESHIMYSMTYKTQEQNMKHFCHIRDLSFELISTHRSMFQTDDHFIYIYISLSLFSRLEVTYTTSMQSFHMLLLILHINNYHVGKLFSEGTTQASLLDIIIIFLMIRWLAVDRFKPNNHKCKLRCKNPDNVIITITSCSSTTCNNFF